MPKAHDIGPLFVQVTNFPYEWGKKVLVRGWTQEIEPPYRTSKPFIVRLPSYKALVFGRWTGTKEEEEALNEVLGRRDLTYEDFTEEAGWVAPPEQVGEESLEDIYSRLGGLDGTFNVHTGQEFDAVAENQRQDTVG